MPFAGQCQRFWSPSPKRYFAWFIPGIIKGPVQANELTEFALLGAFPDPDHGIKGHIYGPSAFDQRTDLVTEMPPQCLLLARKGNAQVSKQAYDLLGMLRQGKLAGGVEVCNIRRNEIVIHEPFEQRRQLVEIKDVQDKLGRGDTKLGNGHGRLPKLTRHWAPDTLRPWILHHSRLRCQRRYEAMLMTGWPMAATVVLRLTYRH